MDDQPTLPEAWQKLLTTFAAEGITNHQFMGFLRLAQPLGLLDGAAVFAVPNELTRDLMEHRLRDQITDGLSSIFGAPILLAVTVNPSLDEAVQTTQPSSGEVQNTVDLTLFGQDTTVTRLDEEAVVETRHRVEMLKNEPDTEVADVRDFWQRSTAPKPVAPLLPPQQPASNDHLEVVTTTHDLTEPPSDNDDRFVVSTTVSSLHDRQPSDDARLNPKYTFDTFVIGNSNRFAAAACLTVAETPAKAYNPLFVYGGSGLGKTHLLHAIGDYALSLYPGVKVRYVNSEEFTNDFINMLREERPGEFQRRYREVDFLLIDDIQFLQGKEGTMEEFFHTFNTLHNNNKQVVITSDMPPKQLSGFEDRMRSRFEWGLLSDVQPPNLETRIAILQKKAAADNRDVPNPVMEYIAQRITTNIRELEGALIRITAFANLTNQEVDTKVAEEVLKDLITDTEGQTVTVASIMTTTSEYFNFSIDDLAGVSRSRDLVMARQIAMYLCRELTDLSLPKIGQAFGGRDHTTVIHANRKIKEAMNQRRNVFNQVTELTQRIKQQTIE